MGDAQPWKYEDQPGNEFLHVLVDLFWRPTALGVDVTVLHNQAADSRSNGIYQIYELEAEPTVDQVAGSMKYGEPVLHPRVRLPGLTAWSGVFSGKCETIPINNPDWADRWWIFYWEENFPFGGLTQYTSPPFKGSDFPGSGYSFPCP